MMGKVTKKLTKRKKPKKDPFGDGTMATVSATLDPGTFTKVEELIETYGGRDSCRDFLSWLAGEPGPKDDWKCESPEQPTDLIAYTDPAGVVVFARTMPKGTYLGYSHPVENFVPDISIAKLFKDFQNLVDLESATDPNSPVTDPNAQR